MLEELLMSPKRSPMVAVCCIDIDNFSALNIEFGNDIGDQVLVDLENRLSRFLGPNDFMARSSGDQFYLCVDVAQKAPVFRQLQEHIQLPLRIGEHLHSLTASIGISLVTAPQNSPDRAIRNAMHACITIKNKGGGKYEIFDDEGSQIQHGKSRLIFEVTEGLAANQFQLYLQPKINLSDRSLTGFEALIRWHHPQRGVVSPLSFLPQIANTDAEVLLGHYLLEHGIELLKKLYKKNYTISLSLNISPRQLTDAWFRRQIEHYAELCPELMSLLCLEILESDSFDNLPLIQDCLTEYQAFGLSLSLDDFGTGFASLNHLMKLPLNEVKIDRDFIKDIDTNAIHQIVVRHIVELSAALQLTTVAEGIETETEANTVTQLGVQLAQGYYYARPFPSSEMFDWLATYQQTGVV
jgi:diguanylate cyclase (GGDEF)-like protein